MRCWWGQRESGLFYFYFQFLRQRRSCEIRKLKQQRRLRKRHLKTEFALLFWLYRAFSIFFNSSNVGEFFQELNFKGLYQSSGKEKEGCCLVVTQSCNDGKEMHKKACKVVVLLIKSIAFLPFSLLSPSSLLKLTCANTGDIRVSLLVQSLNWIWKGA